MTESSVTPLPTPTHRRLGLLRPTHVVIDLEAICHPLYGVRPYALPLLEALKERGYTTIIVGVRMSTNLISDILTAGGIMQLINAYTNSLTSTEMQWHITASSGAVGGNPKSWYVAPWDGSKRDRGLEKYVKSILGL